MSYRYAEPILFPVIKHVAINSLTSLHDGSIIIDGEYKKVRNCEFIDAMAIGDDDFLLIEYNIDKQQIKTSKSKDVQFFKTWHIKTHNNASIKMLTLYALHKCANNSLLTKLITIDVNEYIK